MTNYTNAPACKLLATHCCACNTPLLDAKSIEIGMGPDCRQRLMGKKLPVTEEARKEANKIVHQLALLISGYKPDQVEGLDTEAVQAAYALGGTKAVGAMLAANHKEGATLLDRLRVLGFDKLADKFEKNWLPIRITREGTNLLVVTPFNEAAITAWYGIKGQAWDKVRKCRVVPAGAATLNGPDTNSGKVWALLQAHYAGLAGIGPKGPFVVAPKAKPAPVAVMMTPKAPKLYADMTDAEKAKIDAEEDAREARKAALARATEQEKMDALDLAMARIEAEGDRAGTLRDEYFKALAKGMLA